MKHYRDVRGLGNVAVSRHAQERIMDARISQAMFERVLLSGTDTPMGTKCGVAREGCAANSHS